MQRCTHCNAQQIDGTIFCSECGASLLANSRSRETTAALNKAASGGPPVFTELEPTTVNAPAPIAAPMIYLVVINSGRRIALDPNQELLVGRKDNQRGIFPDVDLGLDGGYDAGVSRRHAIITNQGGSFIIEDLASANGTFVNGQRLQPPDTATIRNGDELKFGTLILRFEIQ